MCWLWFVPVFLRFLRFAVAPIGERYEVPTMKVYFILIRTNTKICTGSCWLPTIVSI